MNRKMLVLELEVGGQNTTEQIVTSYGLQLMDCHKIHLDFWSL